ncbi:MAG: hypothetical protein V3G42_13570 [Oscillospiraceae bacterium]
MYKPNFKTDHKSLPVLSRNKIDEIAECFLWDYQPGVFRSPAAIDIDGFLEEYLRATPDYQYLSNNMIYLGMTVFLDTNRIPVFNPYKNKAEYFSAKANTVIFDTRLIEETNQEHRYRFTAGHECGHLIFHRPYFLRQHQFCEQFGIDEEIMQCKRMDLLGTKKCRLQTDSDWLEWQANQFSGSFLMPKTLVLEIVDDCGYTRAGFFSAVSEMESIFNVSNEAAANRLRTLGVLDKMNEKIRVSS